MIYSWWERLDRDALHVAAEQRLEAWRTRRSYEDARSAKTREGWN